MPNRLLRDGAMHSRALNSVSEGAENLFYRLIQVADDFALFEADPYTLKSRCYCFRAAVGLPEIESRLAELAGANLVRLYDADGRALGAILKWNQVRWSSKPKFPLPEWGTEHIIGGYVRKPKDPEAPPPKAKKRGKSNGLHPISDDWLPSEKTIARLGAEFKLTQPQIQAYFDHFVSACKSKDYRYKDFDAAFSNSVRADWPRLRESEKPAGNLKGGPMPTPARPCDYCGAKSIGTVNGFSHCRAHSDSALFHEQPTRTTQ